MNLYVVVIEVPSEHAMISGVFPTQEQAKKHVFEQEHMYDDESVLVPDVRDVRWESDGDNLIASALDDSCIYTIAQVEADLSA